MASSTDIMTNITNELTYYITLLFIVILAIAALVFIIMLVLKLIRVRKREAISLDTVLLQVALPKDNEIKIDAAEQMFASLYALYKDGFDGFINQQPHISFEIVGKKEDKIGRASCRERV